MFALYLLKCLKMQINCVHFYLWLIKYSVSSGTSSLGNQSSSQERHFHVNGLLIWLRVHNSSASESRSRRERGVDRWTQNSWWYAFLQCNICEQGFNGTVEWNYSASRGQWYRRSRCVRRVMAWWQFCDVRRTKSQWLRTFLYLKEILICSLYSKA